MKKKAYVKNQIQIIRRTKARFLSIFCIVFLGAAFFAGLRHTSSIMEITMNDYLNEYKYNDLNYIATLGFDVDIIDKVKDVKDVQSVEYGNRFDALINFRDSSKGVTVYSNTNFNNKINKPEVVKGKLPTKDNECVIDYNFTKKNKVGIGDRIILVNNNGTKEFIVTGLINDSRYFSTIERGTNTLGDGTNEGFVEILSSGNENLSLPQELYDLQGGVVFNELRVLLKNPYNYSVFSDEYLEYIKKVDKQVKKVLNDEIDKTNKKLANDANSEIDQGEENLLAGEIEYNEGVSKYDEGLKQYNQGYQQYQEGLKQYSQGYQQFQEGQRQYNEGKLQYEQGWQAYLSGKAQYDQGVSEWHGGLDQYNQLLIQYQQLNQLYKEKQKEYNDYIEAGIPEESLSELKIFLNQTKDNLIVLQTTYTDLKEKLDQSKAELDTKEILLDQSKAKLEKSKKELDESKIQLDNTEITLKESKQQLDDSKKTLDNSKLLLDQTKLDLDNAKIKLDDVRSQLDSGRNNLKNIPQGKLVSLTREENASILSYLSTCESMEALAVVFPLIFFLVAALVSLTTMTRMVEEQRVQSGTFRALGYEKKDVINQYLIYAFLATFFASVLGIILGVYFFPGIIYFLYQKMLFNVGANINITFDGFICIQTFIISVAITMFVTYVVVHQELNETPSNLLRPKPPKMGKRIILERINLIWKKLSFNQKVTMRNIFRYKKRFFMSIIGIAGCTALIVVGFGIKNSVSTLADKQYGEIWTYDGVTVFDKNLSQEDLKLEQQKFNQLDDIKDSGSFYRKTVSIYGNKEYYGTLEVFENNQELSKYIELEDYRSHKKLQLSNDGVIISAKLSELLEVKAGDKIKIKIDNESYQVKVSGVMRLYFQHHIYMSEEFYHKLTDDHILKNYTYFNLVKSDNQKVISKYCDQNDKISSVNFIQGISQGFRDQMGSIDSVVVILIACAGALAFIVLYNLTNINIQERKSEIATIKVLGFYPREVYDYVFRENRILGLIGAFVGLGIGKVLHMFIISTVEVEVAMFVRSVNLMSYVYAIVITMLFTSFINFIMRKVLNNIDMVESLKSIE
ncbi:FtsX-like permease family protein [Thomasclavelia sp.]